MAGPDRWAGGRRLRSATVAFLLAVAACAPPPSTRDGVPPAPGAKSPALWGNKVHLETLFGTRASVAAETKNFVFRYKSPEHFVEIFRNYYGPVLKTFAAIDPEARRALEADMLALIDRCNLAEDGTMVVPSEYLEVVITRNA